MIRSDQIVVFVEVKVGVGFGVGGLESWKVVRSDLGLQRLWLKMMPMRRENNRIVVSFHRMSSFRKAALTTGGRAVW